ncbi:MalY/PatB family protein [Diplocloster agilis]|uniref:MalY/PatB family protein n=1 Tax=Diplocloster agilis TaxID=2850323 RepID=UPI000820758F|nr:MalY/PatB family protein [Suonthocola fibrivorans]MCU6735680.1 pyridoxal phosphate-dependent aminotransferase [Suonthocola fibrivorans]SCJ79444.1 Cystathionine beta-lyase PatB [uncultured Clostridium sp.]
MKYDFDEVIDRRGTYSIKWDSGEQLIRKGLAVRVDDDTIPLFTADMDLACPQPVLEALRRVVDHRIFGYSDCTVVPEYYEAVISWFHRRYGWQIEKDEILYVNGTVEALQIAVEAFTQEGDGIIIQRPVYGPFSGTIDNTHRKLINNQLLEHEGYYTINYEDLEQKARDPQNKMMFLCSPHNPVGRVWTPEELRKIACICRKNDVLLVVDEIHGDIIRKDVRFYPMAAVADTDPMIICTAVNKTFNLAGLQCSNIIIKDPELRETFRAHAGYRAPTPFAIAALIAAYQECDDWVGQMNDYIDGNIQWVLDFLKERMPKVKCARPEGTYILWMDFRGYGLPAEEIRDRIYNRANVILEAGSVFDPEYAEGYERVCLGTRRSLIQEAFERIARQF